MKDLFELIRSLRTETPSAERASKTAWWFGIICFGVAVWNLLIVSTMTPGEFPFELDTFENRTALALITLSGFVALLAASRLKSDPVSGARVAKVALWLWLGGLVMFLAGLWTNPAASPPGFMGMLFRIFMIPVIAQFVVPGWFALGYLSRLEHAAAGGRGA